MITKRKKVEIIDEGVSQFDGAKLLLFADFKGAKVEELKELRRTLKETNSKFRVMKKRLLRIIFQKKGIDFDPLKFEGQVGTIFGSGEIAEVVQPIYKFSKDHPSFKLVGGLNIEKKEEVPFEMIQMIGSLPPREILLAQLMGTLTAPFRGLMYILSEKSKQAG